MRKTNPNRETNLEASRKMLAHATAGEFGDVLLCYMKGGDPLYKNEKGTSVIIELAKGSYGECVVALVTEINADLLKVTDNGGGTAATWLAYRGQVEAVVELAQFDPTILEHFCNYGSSVATLLATRLDVVAVRALAHINPAVFGQPVIAAVAKSKASDAEKDKAVRLLKEAGFTK